MFKFLQEKHSPLWVVVGLGNPGSQYSQTRHNIGFVALDFLGTRFNATFRGKFLSELGQAEISAAKCILVKPQTYMNLSGRAVREVLAWHKLGPENLIVIYDDMDLQLGKIRLRPKGGAGGHNGIKSLIAELGTDNFARIKIGIGRPPENWDPANYVLSNFGSEEKEAVAGVLSKVEKSVETIISEGMTAAMNKLNC